MVLVKRHSPSLNGKDLFHKNKESVRSFFQRRKEAKKLKKGRETMVKCWDVGTLAYNLRFPFNSFPQLPLRHSLWAHLDPPRICYFFLFLLKGRFLSGYSSTRLPVLTYSSFPIILKEFKSQKIPNVLTFPQGSLWVLVVPWEPLGAPP